MTSKTSSKSSHLPVRVDTGRGAAPPLRPRASTTVFVSAPVARLDSPGVQHVTQRPDEDGDEELWTHSRYTGD